MAEQPKTAANEQNAQVTAEPDTTNNVGAPPSGGLSAGLCAADGILEIFLDGNIPCYQQKIVGVELHFTQPIARCRGVEQRYIAGAAVGILTIRQLPMTKTLLRRLIQPEGVKFRCLFSQVSGVYTLQGVILEQSDEIVKHLEDDTEFDLLGGVFRFSSLQYDN